MNTSIKKRMCIVLLVGRSTIVEPVSKERAFPAWCCTKQTKLSRQLFSQVGVYCTHRVLCYLSAFGLPELDLLQSSGQSLFTKTYWVSIHTNELRSF